MNECNDAEPELDANVRLAMEAEGLFTHNHRERQLVAAAVRAAAAALPRRSEGE